MKKLSKIIALFFLVTMFFWEAQSSYLAYGASFFFKESWEKSNNGIYLPKHDSLSPIVGDEGLWHISATVDGEPPPDGCGATPHKAEIFEESGNKKLKLVANNSYSECADNVWIWWSREYSGNSKQIPISPDTHISFNETGKMFGSAGSTGWGSDNCGLGMPCGIHLGVIDNRGNVVFYRLQSPIDAKEDIESKFITILLKPDDGFYSRNLFSDFNSIPDFNTSGAYVEEIVFQIHPWDDSTSTLGWAVIDDLVITNSTKANSDGEDSESDDNNADGEGSNHDSNSSSGCFIKLLK